MPDRPSASGQDVRPVPSGVAMYDGLVACRLQYQCLPLLRPGRLEVGIRRMSSDVLEIFSFTRSMRWSTFERSGSSVSRISSSESSERVLWNSTFDFPLSVLRLRSSCTSVALCLIFSLRSVNK